MNTLMCVPVLRNLGFVTCIGEICVLAAGEG